MTLQSLVRGARAIASPKAGAADKAYLPFVAASLLIAVLGGFALAIALPVDAALGYNLDERWPALAQAHGHLQVAGFAGLFVMGMAFRLAPRFASTKLALPGLSRAVFPLVLTAVIGRAALQPFADEDVVGALLVLAAALEVAGSVCFAVVILATIRHALSTYQSFAPFFAAGAVWCVVQAVLSLVWLVDIAGESITIPAARNELLLTIQIYGFLLCYILGVAVRSFPIFFGVEDRDRWPAWLFCGLLQLGLLAYVTARLGWVDGSDPVWQVEGVALVVMAAAITLTTARAGFWRPATGLREQARSLAIILRAVLVWLLVACAALSYLSVQALAEERILRHAETDAVRHIIALGVVLLVIIGMGQLVLPELATERLKPASRRLRALAFTAIVSLAVVLRSLDGLTGNHLDSDVHHWLVATSGVLGMLVICAFGALFLRAWRSQPMLLQQVSHRIETVAAPN